MTLIVDVGGTTACTKHGQLAVAQSLQLHGPALKVALTSGFVPVAGDSFKILASPATSGSFGSIALPTLPQGLSWNTSALSTQGIISVEAAGSANRSGGGGGGCLSFLPLLALVIVFFGKQASRLQLCRSS
jgi:hypothetical protein